MGAWLRSQPFAHGDIKPDNIIVKESGELVLIDYDGMYVSSMAGESSPTMGTQDFRHPLRTSATFDDTIDDFSLASIALSLKAISLDSTLLDRFGAPDRLLFSAKDYLNLPNSAPLVALQDHLSDRELSKLFALFLIAHSEQALSATSFRLFSTVRPQRPVVEALSTEVSDEDRAEAYVDDYGVMYSPDRKRLLRCSKSISTYTIPDGVMVICNEAFDDCFGLRALTLPSSLTSIGANPFLDTQVVLENH
ncbi:leucine-rich repeat protein, partial [Porphyromonas levii]